MGGSTVHNVYSYYCGVFSEKYVYTKYGLRLFIVVLQELPNCLHVCMIRVRGCLHITKFPYSTPSSF